MLVIGGSMKRLRARFRAQFTPTGDGYIYRRGSRGPALPVSAADADAFVAGFDRAMRWLGIGGVLAGMAMYGTLTFLGRHVSDWVVIGPYAAIMAALFWLAWNAPHRVLDGRAPVTPALSGPEVRRNGLRTLPWPVLVLGALVSAGLAVRVAFEPDPTSPMNLRYLAFAATLLLAFGAMALAKVRTR